jgi:hypothetical protein
VIKTLIQLEEDSVNDTLHTSEVTEQIQNQVILTMNYKKPEHFSTDSSQSLSDDELEDTWKYYIKKYVNNDLENLDLLRLNHLEVEIGNRGWAIKVDKDSQDVDRNPEDLN